MALPPLPIVLRPPSQHVRQARSGAGQFPAPQPDRLNPTVPRRKRYEGPQSAVRTRRKNRQTVEPEKRKLLQILGPGLITGASDDDPSGIATYSQAGAQFGYDLGWTLLFSWPLMCAIQEISARIGRVTGRGIAGNLKRHYPAAGGLLADRPAGHRQHHQSWRRSRRYLARRLDLVAGRSSAALRRGLRRDLPSCWKSSCATPATSRC